MREEWRPVVGYEGLYEVSNMGRVRSVKRTVWDSRGYYKIIQERIRKPRKNNNGYLQVFLHKEGKRKNCTIHRLVAQAFLPNPDNLPEVNHKDENPLNNNINNLEWCTRKYNQNYGTRNIRAGKSISKTNTNNPKLSKALTNNPKLSKSVIAISKVSGLIVEFSSIREAERQLGISHSDITKCCKGKKKSAGNYYWMYANNNDAE